MFTYYSISALINFLFSLLASIFLIITTKKKLRDNDIFAFLRYAFFVIFWSAFYFLWQISTDHTHALLYSKLLISFAAFVPISYLDYAVTSLGYKNKNNSGLILLGYLLFLWFIIKGLVFDVVPKLSFLYWPVGTSIFPVFLFMWLFISVFSMAFLGTLFFSKKHEKNRNYIFLLLLALILGAVGGVTNYFLWFGIPIKPFGNILVSFFFFITLYTVRKYNVVNLRLFYIQLPVLVVCLFSFGRIFVSASQFDFYTNVLFFIVTTIASVYIIRSSAEQEKDQVNLKSAIKRVEVLNKKLIELDKHKNDFVSIAAHQLRTPAGVIKNYVSMMKQGMYGEFDKKLVEPIDRIYENGVLLAGTVSSLLDISRIESGKQKVEFTENDLSELLKKIISELTDNAKKKNLTLNFEVKEGIDYKAIIDKEKTEHMFMNLIDNSIKYTDSGSVTVKAYGNNGNVVVDVIDTGRGMSKEFIDTQLYQKFAREESVTKNVTGNGLGMYYVKEVVDLHKGKITVKSESGKGTTFTVSIPKVAQKIKGDIKVGE